jgi:hypothetical protein
MTVYGVDPYNGFAYYRGDFWVGPNSEWEAEGLTIWDLTGGQSPGINGHVHVQLLDNDDLDTDNYWFGHFQADEPWRL